MLYLQCVKNYENYVGLENILFFIKKLLFQYLVKFSVLLYGNVK